MYASSGQAASPSSSNAQAIAYALCGICTKLGDEVHGSGGIKWGTLVNDGLILALFAGDDGKSEELQRRTTISLLPRASPAGYPPALQVVIHAPEPQPEAMAVDGAEEPKSPTSATVPAATPYRSPVLHTATPIGIRQSTSPAPDPAAVDVTVQLCPMVMSLVWPGLQLPMMTPVAHMDYHESSQRKEKIDLGALLIPLFLWRLFLEHLDENVLPLKTILRCSWISPSLAGVQVILPPDSEALGVVGRIPHQLTPDLFDRAVVAGHAALELTAEPRDEAAVGRAEAARKLAQSDKLAYAFSGSDNWGLDTFLTLNTAQPADEYLLVGIGSKQSASIRTHTLDYALEEMVKDLENSGICVEGRDHVEALGSLPEVGWATKSGREVRPTRKARQSKDVGGFRGGSMMAFEEVAKEATEQVLNHWADQLRERSITLPHGSKGPFVYMFVTDLRMTTKQRARHEVLALAGHKYASRLVLVDQDQHDSFYGIASALTRNFEKAADK